MALGEDLLLLAIPSRGGQVRGADHIGFVLRASVLVDLVLAGRIRITSRRIEVIDPSPLDDRRLSNALTTLRGSASVPSVGEWVRATPRGNAMVTTYLSALADQGAVRFDRRQQRAAIPPRADLLKPERRAAVRARLDDVARGRPAPDADLALASLVRACGLDRYLYRAPFGLRARRRLARLAQRAVTADVQAARASTDAALALVLEQSISNSLEEVTREVYKLVQHELHRELRILTEGLEYTTGDHGDRGGTDSSAGGHHR